MIYILSVNTDADEDAGCEHIFIESSYWLQNALYAL